MAIIKNKENLTDSQKRTWLRLCGCPEYPVLKNRKNVNCKSDKCLNLLMELFPNQEIHFDNCEFNGGLIIPSGIKNVVIKNCIWRG